MRPQKKRNDGGRVFRRQLLLKCIALAVSTRPGERRAQLRENTARRRGLKFLGGSLRRPPHVRQAHQDQYDEVFGTHSRNVRSRSIKYRVS